MPIKQSAFMLIALWAEFTKTDDGLFAEAQGRALPARLQNLWHKDELPRLFIFSQK